MKTLEVLYERTPRGFIVKSPAVGYASRLPVLRQLVTAKACVGRLQILGTYYSLCLPESLAGKVEEVEMERLSKPVAYEEPLFSLGSIEAQTFTKPEDSLVLINPTHSGKIVIAAPTDGVFYQRPTPEAAPYVELGTVVKAGQILGLVEVMKCFSQITFSGPEEAKVLEICATNGAEVKYQQPLFILG